MVATIDLIVIAAYLVLITAVAFAKRTRSLEAFMINDRRTQLLLNVLSIVSTNIGAGFFLGVAAAAYSSGISFGLFIMGVVFSTAIFLAYFAPRLKKFGDENKAYTIGDYFDARYSRANRLLVAFIIAIAYVFVVALQFVGIAGVASAIAGVNFELLILISGLVTILYIAAGGFKADIYTGAVSFIVSILALALTVPVIISSTNAFAKIAVLPPRYFNPFEFGGISFMVVGLLFGVVQGFLALELWQRIFTATDSQTARRSFLISAFVQIPIIAVPIVLGLLTATIYTNENENIVLFHLFRDTLPPGLFGLGLVAILTIILDTVTGLTFAGAATLTNDFYARLVRRSPREQDIVRVGRISIVIYGCIGLLLALLMPSLVRLLLIASFLLLPFGPAVIGGLIWRRANSKASFVSILVGFLITLVLIPVLPDKAFIPGTLTSLILFVLLSFAIKTKS